MKRNLLIATLAFGLAASTMAQGVIAIGASSGKIKYTLDGTNLVSLATGNPASVLTYGQFNMAVYAATAGTALATGGNWGALGAAPDFSQNGWAIQTSTLQSHIGPATGFIANTATTMPLSAGAANATEQLEVVAWTGNFTSFAAAVAAGTGLVGWEGSSLIPGGSTLTFQFTTGDGVLSTPIVTLSASGWNGLVLAPQVPEPGTILLGGLGAASLLLFRRRK